MPLHALTILLAGLLALAAFYVIYRWTGVLRWTWLIALFMLAPSVEGYFAPSRAWSTCGVVTTFVGILLIARLVRSRRGL